MVKKIASAIIGLIGISLLIACALKLLVDLFIISFWGGLLTTSMLMIFIAASLEGGE